MSLDFVDLNGNPLKPQASFAAGGSGSNGEMARWAPSSKSVDAALLPALRLGNARAEDLARNHGIASSGVQLHIDNIVGDMFRLSARPKWKTLGISEEDARAWATDVEQCFQEYAEDEVNCWLDAERKRTFTMLIREAVGTHTRTGEIAAAALYLDRPGTRYKTCVKVINPNRISNPGGVPDTDALRGGVECDRYGAAKAYHVQNSSVSAFSFGRDWVRIPKFSRHGRQRFLHVFEPTGDGQTRGINQFMSVMSRLKMLDKYQGTQLETAIVNAMYAAVIESEMSSEDAYRLIGGESGGSDLQTYLSNVNAYHEGVDLKLGGSSIPHLMPGEELKLLRPGNTAQGFASFESSILRYVAAGLNVGYEQLTKDYSKTNYSSARASMLETWRYMMGRRKVIASRYASMIYRLWLEEAIDRRDVTLPRKAKRDFWEAPGAWGCANWIGSGRLQIDGLKETKELVLKLEAGLISYEKACALMGEDYQELFAQQVREIAERREAGLPPPSWMATQVLSPDEQDEQEQVNGGNKAESTAAA
ncbi:phage portal protein [Oceanospirillum sp. HFRX-1_2]